MSEDTMIKRMDKSAFFDSVTWLNQENWQKFFGKSLPNGILVNHALKLDTTGYRLEDMMDLVEGNENLTIGTGSVMANGLYAEIITPTSVTNVTSAEKTKLIVIRYDSDESFASIVQKVDVLSEDSISITNAIRNFVVDESFLCTRNESIYEIPIAFQYYSGGVYTVDLRHFVYAPSGMKRVLSLDTVYNSSEVELGVLRGNNYAQLIGGTSYTIEIKPTDSAEYFDIYPMVVNSNEPITLFIKNGSGEIKKLNLKKMFSNIPVGYEWVDGWTENTHGINISLAIASTMVIRLDVVKQTVDGTTYSVTTKSIGSGGGVDPVTVYTKAEIDNMLAVKANSSDVNQQLAVKENIANLKSLAYKNKVNYETEVTNKPTWNSVAKQYFYVDGDNGNDGNSGDQGSPFKTIQKAIDSVNINSIGEITIAHGTYLEHIEIDSKNIILKQKDFDDNFIIIAPQVTTENQLEYAFTISDNSIVKIIGNFSIRNSVNCILIDSRSSLFIDGDYTIVIQNGNSTRTEKKYSVLEVILRYSGEDAGLAKWTGHGINIRSGSQLITESLNLVDIKNAYIRNGPANSGYGIFLDKCNICYVYKFQFYGLYKNIYSDQGLLYTHDVSSNKVLYKPSGFGTLAHKDSVNYETEVTNKPKFGTLAFKNNVNYETEVVNKPIQNTFYVSTDGNDDNDGTQNSPFRTIQHAIDKIELLGGKIYITPGTYGSLDIDNKNIEFYIQYEGRVTLNGSAFTLRVKNNSVVKFMSGIWDITDLTYQYGTNTIIDIDCSTVIFNSDVKVSELNLQTLQIKINNASKVVFNNLNMHSSHANADGLRLYKASFCYIGNLSADGGYSGVSPILAVNGGIIMYRESNTTNYFQKSNGGLILTGSNN